jgi:hypothetical protein
MRAEFWLDHYAGGRNLISAPRIQAFDNRRQVLVRPDEIRPGDWLRDLGALRQVESVEEAPSAIGSGRISIVHFVSSPGVEDLELSIPGTVTVTIWRPA